MAAINDAGLSRRSFLLGTAGLGAAGALVACGDGSGGGGSTSGGSLSLLLPGDVPPEWDRVLGAVNEKLETDLGFTIAPEFIAWSNYAAQSLLKFTAGEDFDTALSARWLNIAQLVESGAIVGLDDAFASGDYPELQATVAQDAFDANRWPDGTVYGIPAVNSAARLHHYTLRADLVDTYAGGSIDSFDQLEQFWYDVHQGEGIPGFIRGGASPWLVLGGPTGVFFPEGWEDPSVIPVFFSSDSLFFVPAADAASTGSSDLVPFWEHQPYVEALRRVRQYYEDGIINADMLNIDTATAKGQFTSGGAASVWAITDGTSTSSQLPELTAAVPGASLMNVMPFAAGLAARPSQTFQADNMVVLNASGSDNTRALQLLDWVSKQENHDLLQYGIEGTDWELVDGDRYRQTGTYANFPGYALSWRVDRERKAADMSESEDELFTWSQDYSNFERDPFSSFIPDLGPVETEHSQITAAIAEFGSPLWVGAKDVDSGLDELKRAMETAGYEKVLDELRTQADAYLADQG
jgi:putative aldouronate transport system substrate-binding protein